MLVASAAGFGFGLSGLPFYTVGVFVLPLTKAFGWSTSQVQGGLTLLLLANVITLPIAAMLVERFGARTVALTSVVMFALGFMSFSTLDGQLWAFYLRCILLSVAGAGTLAVTWTRAIGAVFHRRRGFALGIALMGTGLTALAAPIATNALIQRLGWRWAYTIVGSAPLLIAGPLVWFLFWDETPKTPGGGQNKARFAGPILVRDPRFWLVGGPFFLIGMGVAGVLPNLVKLLAGHGYSPSAGASVASLVGLFVILGRLGGGYLLDRVWPPALAAIFFISAAAACLILRIEGLNFPLLLAAAAALGLAAGAELDMLPYLTIRYFGLNGLSGVLGAVSTFFYLGSALGPWSFAWIKEIAHGYAIPLAMDAAFFAAGAAGLLGLGFYGGASRQLSGPQA
jgi:MFS family permease